MQLSRRGIALLCTLCLPLAGCFEQPIAESLVLAFLPDHAVTVTATVAIHYLEDDNQVLRQRVEEVRRALLDGRDEWSRRLEALRPVHERTEIEKLEGEVTRVVRSGTTDDPDAVRRFFADTGVQVVWTEEESRGELEISPAASGRATRRERQEVARALDEWSAAIGDYLGAAGALYEYLERHPERDRACFSLLFKVAPDQDSDPETQTQDDAWRPPELLREETTLVEAVDKAMDEVAKALLVAKGEAYSLDEMSRRVYDPFPASVTIRLPGPIIEMEGFETPARASGGEGRELRVRELGLWSALRGLEGTWIAPDPLLAVIDHDLRGDDTDFDLEGWLEKNRRHEDVPAAPEIKRRLEARLEPEPVYRVVWVAPAGGSEE